MMNELVHINNANFGQLFDRRINELLGSDLNRELIGQKAYDNFKRHYGCAQSMLRAFMDVLGLRDDFWFRAIGGLQGGGGCGLTCGALNAGFILISAKTGRRDVREGMGGLMGMLEPNHRLAQWFKLQYRSTVCSEISGFDWFNTAGLMQQHMSEKGKERQESCARLTSGTAFKLTEILYEL